jgi:hypothetical protein
MHQHMGAPKLFIVNLNTINFSLIWHDNTSVVKQSKNVGSSFKYYKTSKFADVFTQKPITQRTDS